MKREGKERKDETRKAGKRKRKREERGKNETRMERKR